jgi:hypothetical protein
MTISEVVGSVRPLTARDLPEVYALLAADPVAHCFVAQGSGGRRRSVAPGWRHARLFR